VAAEVGSAAEAEDDDIEIVAEEFELLLGFEANDGLMHENVVEDRAQAVSRCWVLLRILKTLGNGDAQRTYVVGILFIGRPPHFGQGTGEA